MTTDPRRSFEEMLRVKQGCGLFYCVIRNIWTILKHDDGPRRLKCNIFASAAWRSGGCVADVNASKQLLPSSHQSALCTARGAAESRAGLGPVHISRNQATCCQ